LLILSYNVGLEMVLGKRGQVKKMKSHQHGWQILEEVPGLQQGMTWSPEAEVTDRERPTRNLFQPSVWFYMYEQANNPGKLTCHLIEGHLMCPSDENQQLLAQSWGLTCTYRGTAQHSQRTVAKAGTQTASKDNTVEVGTQTTTSTVTAPHWAPKTIVA